MYDIELDGQSLHILDAGEMAVAIREGTFAARPIGAVAALKKLAPIITRNEQLRLSLTLYRPNAPFWAPIVLVQIRGEWFRIALDHRFCSNCDWQGYIGTIAPADLYIGIPCASSARERASRACIGDCPVCGTLIESGLIWAEPADSALRTTQTARPQ